MSEAPETVTGRGLAAFLHGLMPETSQFDRQIAWIEQEAVELARLAAHPAPVNVPDRMTALGFPDYDYLDG